jgi:hypothetical protein
MKNVEGFPSRKIDNYDVTPCDLIFSITEKPKDYLMCKCFNVYDNKWRINVYSKRYVEGIEGRYISKSYFASMNNNELKILS